MGMVNDDSLAAGLDVGDRSSEVDALWRELLRLRRVVGDREVLVRQLGRDVHELREEFFASRAELWGVVKELQSEQRSSPVRLVDKKDKQK